MLLSVEAVAPTDAATVSSASTIWDVTISFVRDGVPDLPPSHHESEAGGFLHGQRMCLFPPSVWPVRIPSFAKKKKKKKGGTLTVFRNLL